MQKISILLCSALLMLGLFSPVANAQNDDAMELSFSSVSLTKDKGTSVLIIPMNGQMSTDITIDPYESLFTKIEELNPDLIVFEMFCQDFATEFLQTQGRGDRKEFNGYDPDAVKELVRLFRVRLKDIQQVMWIQDSCGGSSVLTFGWPDIYMSKDAKLQGTHNLARNWNYIDREKPTYHKMYNAWTAHAKNVAEIGGRSHDFIMTFVDPERTVSGKYEGREVVWKRGLDGNLVFDGGPNVPNIDASDAEQFAISKATVQDLNDILLSEGIRQYHLVGEDVTKSIEEYKISWRKSLDKATNYWIDSQQYETWAQGEDTERYLRKQLTAVKQTLKLLERWKAVSFRMMREFGISKDGARGTLDLRKLIKDLEEKLRKLRESEDTGRGGRGGGGLAGSSGGGRPR